MSSNRRKSINSWAQPPPPVLQPQNTAVPSVSARNRTRSAQTTFTPAVGQGTALDPPATGWGRVPVNAGASAVLPIRNAGREPLPPRRDHSRVRSVSVTGTEVYQFRKSILKPQTPAPTQPPQKPSGGAPTAYIEPPVIPGITVPAPEPVKSNDPRWNPYIYKGAGHRFSRTSPYAIEFEGKSYKSSEELFKHMMGIQGMWPNPDGHAETRDSEEALRVMAYAVLLKFCRHDGLRDELIKTGEQPIQDGNLDSYWGCGVDGKGRNKLGRALELVRDKMREIQQRRR